MGLGRILSAGTMLALGGPHALHAQLQRCRCPLARRSDRGRCWAVCPRRLGSAAPSGRRAAGSRWGPDLWLAGRGRWRGEGFDGESRARYLPHPAGPISGPTAFAVASGRERNEAEGLRATVTHRELDVDFRGGAGGVASSCAPPSIPALLPTAHRLGGERPLTLTRARLLTRAAMRGMRDPGGPMGRSAAARASLDLLVGLPWVGPS